MSEWGDLKKDVKLSDNEKIYRGCVLGMIEVTADGLSNLLYDLKSCPGIVTAEEYYQIEEASELLRSISKRTVKTLKRYGLKEN